MRTEKQISRFVEDELLVGVPVRGDPLASGLLDSLSTETLIAYISDRYDITFTDSDVAAENFASIAALAALVDAKRAERETERQEVRR